MLRLVGSVATGGVGCVGTRSDAGRSLRGRCELLLPRWPLSLALPVDWFVASLFNGATGITGATLTGRESIDGAEGFCNGIVCAGTGALLARGCGGGGAGKPPG